MDYWIKSSSSRGWRWGSNRGTTLPWDIQGVKRTTLPWDIQSFIYILSRSSSSCGRCCGRCCVYKRFCALGNWGIRVKRWSRSFSRSFCCFGRISVILVFSRYPHRFYSGFFLRHATINKIFLYFFGRSGYIFFAFLSLKLKSFLRRSNFCSFRSFCSLFFSLKCGFNRRVSNRRIYLRPSSRTINYPASSTHRSQESNLISCFDIFFKRVIVKQVQPSVSSLKDLLHNFSWDFSQSASNRTLSKYFLKAFFCQCFGSLSRTLSQRFFNCRSKDFTNECPTHRNKVTSNVKRTLRDRVSSSGACINIDRLTSFLLFRPLTFHVTRERLHPRWGKRTNTTANN